MSEELIVDVGAHYVVRNPNVLKCVGLGSCVAVALHEPKKRLGGLCHPMLPWYDRGNDQKSPGKYVDSSIKLMVDQIVEMGGSRINLVAKLVGGAQMFPSLGKSSSAIGLRNVEAAKETLKRLRIHLVDEDIGGTEGRTITFDVRTGAINIKRMNRMVCSI